MWLPSASAWWTSSVTGICRRPPAFGANAPHVMRGLDSSPPAAGGEESNPRITWGAFAPNAEGRLQMPVTLLVHHALADGSHIAKFYDALRAELAAIAARYDAS